MSKVKTSVNIRMPINMKRKIIDCYCSKEYTVSDYIRDAVYEKMDKELNVNDTFTNAIASNKEIITEMSKELNIFLEYFDSFIHLFFVYNPPIQGYDQKKRKILESKKRHSLYRDSFSKSLSKKHRRFVHDLHNNL